MGDTGLEPVTSCMSRIRQGIFANLSKISTYGRAVIVAHNSLCSIEIYIPQNLPQSRLSG